MSFILRIFKGGLWAYNEKGELSGRIFWLNGYCPQCGETGHEVQLCPNPTETGRGANRIVHHHKLGITVTQNCRTGEITQKPIEKNGK